MFFWPSNYLQVSSWKKKNSLNFHIWPRGGIIIKPRWKVNMGRFKFDRRSLLYFIHSAADSNWDMTCKIWSSFSATFIGHFVHFEGIYILIKHVLDCWTSVSDLFKVHFWPFKVHFGRIEVDFERFKVHFRRFLNLLKSIFGHSKSILDIARSILDVSKSISRVSCLPHI